MSDRILLDVPAMLRTYNVSRSTGTTTEATGMDSASIIAQTVLSMTKNPYISPAACFGFVVLILTTVIGNTLVLSALFLDKRLHSPSFFLIANMAIADLLLGLAVLPFSSTLELLKDRWIFGQSFCTAWLALDVLCCTASIMALMAVSIDRYLGVTRPLSYSSIMTIRRTIYLIIIVWALSILTSVVPLFGLTDREQKAKHFPSAEDWETCDINKNTFYTIFSSMISFYIPVIILLILYSRVYQEAKKQGEKLENEKRRLYEIDYQIASNQVRDQQSHSNGHAVKQANTSNQPDENKNDAASTLLNQENIPDEELGLAHALTATDAAQLKRAYGGLKNNQDDDTSVSGSSTATRKSFARRVFGKRLCSTMRRHSVLHSHPSDYHHQISANDELQIIKRKLHNLKREKKAFRTVGLILGALLICWLPFFVTLPIISILKHQEVIKDENTESTWFKITFWLGYCNSALNPFVYAFSNRAIQRAFRQVLFRRCCCFLCTKISNKNNEQQSSQHRRGHSASLTTEISQIAPRQQLNSSSLKAVGSFSRKRKDKDLPPNASLTEPPTSGPVVSFADFLAGTDDDDDGVPLPNDPETNQESISTPADQSSVPILTT